MGEFSLAWMQSSLGVPDPGAKLPASFRDGVLERNSLQARPAFCP